MRFRPRFAGINKAHASRVHILGLLLTDVGQSLTRWNPMSIRQVVLNSGRAIQKAAIVQILCSDSFARIS